MFASTAFFQTLDNLSATCYHDGAYKGREVSTLMIDRQHLEDLFREHGFDDFRWIGGADIVVARWVRMKCIFGCDGYGQSVACPPNCPPVTECERFIHEYSQAVIFHFAKTVADEEERKKWCREVSGRLLEMERTVFLGGHHKAFMMPMSSSCPQCPECVGDPQDCPHPGTARPTPEGLGVDLFATARSIGYPLEVLSDRSQEMNRYAILLVE
jgi:predicted metal-binding protein